MRTVARVDKVVETAIAGIRRATASRSNQLTPHANKRNCLDKTRTFTGSDADQRAAATACEIAQIFATIHSAWPTPTTKPRVSLASRL